LSEKRWLNNATSESSSESSNFSSMAILGPGADCGAPASFAFIVHVRASRLTWRAAWHWRNWRRTAQFGKTLICGGIHDTVILKWWLTMEAHSTKKNLSLVLLEVRIRWGTWSINRQKCPHLDQTSLQMDLCVCTLDRTVGQIWALVSAFGSKGFSLKESEITCGLVSPTQRVLKKICTAKDLGPEKVPIRPIPKQVTCFPDWELSHIVLHSLI